MLKDENSAQNHTYSSQISGYEKNKFVINQLSSYSVTALSHNNRISIEISLLVHAYYWDTQTIKTLLC